MNFGRKFRIPAKGRPRTERGVMNKTEAEYAELLKGRQLAGEIEWFAFEAIGLRLGKKCHYHPDFLVMLSDGVLEVHEVKGGHWEDDARVKIKTAAEKFPFRFVAMRKRSKKDGGGWAVEEF